MPSRAPTVPDLRPAASPLATGARTGIGVAIAQALIATFPYLGMPNALADIWGPVLLIAIPAGLAYLGGWLRNRGYAQAGKAPRTPI